MTDSQNQTREKLLKDIEAFARSKPDLASGGTTAIPKERAGFPALDSAAAAARTPHKIEKPAASAATPAAAPPAPGGSLLDRLRREAQARQMTDSQRFSLNVQKKRFISEAMQATFQYLREFCEQLNILKPAYPQSYNLLGLVELAGLSWHEGRADFRLLPDASDDRLLDQVTLRYRLSAPAELRIERENPAHEAFRIALMEANIGFKEEEIRNQKNHVERTVFTFPCEVKAGLVFAADYGAGDIRLLLKNIRRFGSAEYRLPFEALDHGTFEEMAHLILGEENRFDKSFRRVA